MHTLSVGTGYALGYFTLTLPHVRTYVRTHVRTHARTYARTYVRTYILLFDFKQTSLFIYTSLRLYSYESIHFCICTSIIRYIYAMCTLYNYPSHLHNYALYIC